MLYYMLWFKPHSQFIEITNLAPSNIFIFFAKENESMLQNMGADYLQDICLKLLKNVTHPW